MKITVLLALSAFLQGTAAFHAPTPQQAASSSVKGLLATRVAQQVDRQVSSPGVGTRTADDLIGANFDGMRMPRSGVASTTSALTVKSVESRLARIETKQITRFQENNDDDTDPHLANQHPNDALSILDTTDAVRVQGGSLKTWSYVSPLLERFQVCLKSDGRPLEANIDLWHGPNNTPHKMRVYSENGAVRPFNAVVETPRGPNTVAIRNTGQLEFPMDAFVQGETSTKRCTPRPLLTTNPMMDRAHTIQGGAIRTYPFNAYVDSIQILIKTDGRPLNARIELLQGPNNNKQIMEVYTEDGNHRPFFVIIETPGMGNVVRVVNSATVEFPMTAYVDAYSMSDPSAGLGGDTDFVLGGDDGLKSDRRFLLDQQW